MSAFNPGTGSPTITSTTLEGQVFALASKLQEIEADSVKNPGKLNLITSSISQDTGVANITATIPCTAAISGTGNTSYTYPDPYTGVSFSAGTGSDGTATNIVAAFAERAVKLKLTELTPAKNPNNLSYATISHQLNVSGGTTNATLNVAITLPTQVTVTGTGESRVGKEYLT